MSFPPSEDLPRNGSFMSRSDGREQINNGLATAPSRKVPWGCEIRVHPLSLVPTSTRLKHGPECRCRGREKAIIQRYILDWMSYRITCLEEHPVRTSTRARVAGELLGIDGLDPILNRIDALYPIQK